MTTTTYSFNGGSSDGAAATTASTGGSQVSGDVTHQSSMAVEGAYGLRFVATSSVVAILDVQSFTNDRREEIRICFRMLDTAPTTDTVIIQIYGGSTGTAVIARVRHEFTNLNRISMADTATAHVTTIVNDATAYLGTMCAISLLLDTGTTASDGTMKARFHTNPMDAVGTYLGTEASATGQNLGSVTSTTYPVTRVRVGVGTSSSANRTAGADYLQIDSGATVFGLGAPPAATAPTANIVATPDVYVKTGTTVTLSGTSSTAGSGSITNYAWATTAIPPGAASVSFSAPTGSSTTFVPDIGGRYEIRLTVTQTGGLTDTEDLTIWVHEASNVDTKVYGPAGATAWTNEGGASSITAALNDASQSTWAQSPEDPSPAQTLPQIMNPFGPGTIDIDVEGDYEAGAITRNVKVYKEDGTTVLANDTYALTDAIAIHTVSVTTSGITALADRRALRITVADD